MRMGPPVVRTAAICLQIQGAALSLAVVRTRLPQITPCRAIFFIKRATVQRATSWPSRLSCRQTLRPP
jgi:hypothetical protein